jgi:hypothetical protein
VVLEKELGGARARVDVLVEVDDIDRRAVDHRTSSRTKVKHFVRTKIKHFVRTKVKPRGYVKKP